MIYGITVLKNILITNIIATAVVPFVIPIKRQVMALVF